MKSIIAKFLISACVIGASSQALAVGGVFVAFDDEWRFTDKAFAEAGNANLTTFSNNVASFLKGSAGGGNFLIFSDSLAFSDGNSQFGQALNSAGNSTTYINSTLGLLPSDLSQYDGIFVTGAQKEDNTLALTNFVNSGKGVAVLGGNGFTGEDPARFNPLLSNFGLQFETAHNGVQGVFNTNGTHSIFNGVGQLFYDNGNNVLKLASNNPFSSIVDASNGNGLTGIYDARSAAVPEPSSMLLMLAGGAGLIRKRKRAI